MAHRDPARSAKTIARDLHASIADGIGFSVMVGCGELFIGPFALAVGLGPTLAGLVATIPIIFGAVVQSLAPLAVARLGTNRGWVVLCVALQAASLLPLAWWAWSGKAPAAGLFAAVGVYWASGMASSPAWNAWIGTLVPAGERVSYFARRNQLSQAAVLSGFVAAGAALQGGKQYDLALEVFAILFVVASAARFFSVFQLAHAASRSPRRCSRRRRQPVGVPTARSSCRRPDGCSATSGAWWPARSLPRPTSPPTCSTRSGSRTGST